MISSTSSANICNGPACPHEGSVVAISPGAAAVSLAAQGVLADYGMLSAKSRWAQASTLDSKALLAGWKDEAIAHPLLLSIRTAMNETSPPVFALSEWDTDPQQRMEQIDAIYRLCDYLCLEEFQAKYLEPFQEKFPEVAFEDIPDTVQHLVISLDEGIPVDLLTRFRFLQHLELTGRPSQDFLDTLPHTLKRLAIPRFLMDGLEIHRKEIALAAVVHDGRALLNLSEVFRADRDVVLAAVSQNGFMLQYASADLQADRKVVLAAAGERGDALRYASTELKGDRGVVLVALAQDGCALQHASEGLQADRDVVLAAVAQTGDALRYASTELKGDREVVLAAVGQNGHALASACTALQADRAVVMAAVTQNGYARIYASSDLSADEEVIMAAGVINE